MSMISQLLAPVRPVPMIGVIYDQKFFDAGKNIDNRELTDHQLRMLRESARGNIRKTNAERKKETEDKYVKAMKAGLNNAVDIGAALKISSNRVQSYLNELEGRGIVKKVGSVSTAKRNRIVWALTNGYCK